MKTIIIEGLSGFIDEAYFEVVDNHPDADWVTIESLSQTDININDVIENLKARFEGTGYRKVKITFDNMEGCPSKTQKVLLEEFQRVIKTYPQLKYKIV